ncbi:hypothetical protein K435DRAFT_811152 [Dendrothele bispora CBS 962.96]|uniref:Uncharacterized protein n=1 Tax=Dendrothele bispora (strain CBS 962.96) TaxID=1314807 RepID=A0A4V4HBD8_DENBC|nr:hypothetical protein K435DRAFT_811152 [Dendrothele bispora CBS 962.96]
MYSHHIAGTYGSVLIGALVSSMLSGVLSVQCMMYIRTFASDPLYIKGIVTVVEILDITHSVIIWTGLWEWIVTDFGDMSHVDHIPRQSHCVVSKFSVLLTAITTLMTHWIFGWRIFKQLRSVTVSKNNHLISAPIPQSPLQVKTIHMRKMSSGEMLHLRTFQSFRDQFMCSFNNQWLFSLGLSISVSVDVYITTIMFIILKRTREKSLTVVTVASLICWVTMDNLVFLGLHFIVSKYNSYSLIYSLLHAPNETILFIEKAF